MTDHQLNIELMKLKDQEIERLELEIQKLKDIIICMRSFMNYAYEVHCKTKLENEDV